MTAFPLFFDVSQSFRVAAQWSLLCLATIAATTAASASCGKRPGTPNEVTGRAISADAIEFSWRNTTGKSIEQPRMFFDMYLRGGNNNQIGRDLTGTGPFDVSYGSRSAKTFTGLSPNSRYCFSLRARSAGGTQGCISAITSNVACVNTLAPGAVVAPGTMPNTKPSISSEGRPGNVIIIRGSGFRAGAPVAVRYTDVDLPMIQVDIDSRGPIRADGAGRMSATFNNLCKRKGVIYFTATDGRPVPSSIDHTGMLWSNAATITCT